MPRALLGHYGSVLRKSGGVDDSPDKRSSNNALEQTRDGYSAGIHYTAARCSTRTLAVASTVSAMLIGTILLVFVVAASILLLYVFFTRGAGPDWIWIGGRRNPVRNLFFREDGSWRDLTPVLVPRGVRVRG